MRHLTIIVLAGLITACSDSATGPTPDRSNLAAAPSTAHTVTRGDVSVRFWFDISQPFTGQFGGVQFDVQTHCRRSRLEELWFTVLFDPVGADGAILYELPTLEGPSLTGMGNASIDLRRCESGVSSSIRNLIPAAAVGRITQLRVRVYLQPPPAPSGPSTFLRSPPDLIVFERVNW
jgi:hypothetical protein